MKANEIMVIEMEGDYTIGGTSSTPVGGAIYRSFNFASMQVTTIFVRESHISRSGGHGETGYASTALTSQMIIENFSSFDSTIEIEMAHAKLKQLGGHPPELPSFLTGKISKERLPAPKLP